MLIFNFVLYRLYDKSWCSIFSLQTLFTRMNESFLRQLGRRLVVLGVTNDGGPQCGWVEHCMSFGTSEICIDQLKCIELFWEVILSTIVTFWFCSEVNLHTDTLSFMQYIRQLYLINYYNLQSKYVVISVLSCICLHWLVSVFFFSSLSTICTLNLFQACDFRSGLLLRQFQYPQRLGRLGDRYQLCVGSKVTTGLWMSRKS